MATTDEIFDYVMTNPYNTNPNQLRTMLDSVGSSGGGGGNVVIVTVEDWSGIQNPSMTYDEMKEAHERGDLLMLKALSMPAEYGIQANWYSLFSFYDTHGFFSFTAIIDKTSYQITCSRENVWEKTSISLKPLFDE